MTTSASQDTVLRMALLSMACDKDSTLTTVQRQWIIDLGQRASPLTDHERLRLKAPLLAWIKERQPRILDIVAAQFEPRVPREAQGANSLGWLTDGHD